jgi:glucosamine-6-phosphate deaminase
MQLFSCSKPFKPNKPVILATGNSQLTFLDALRRTPGIDWSKVNVFHMDEYINLEPGHPASFPLFLHRHFLDHLQPAAGKFFPVPSRSAQPEDACRDYEGLLRANPCDLCALGIGENGHIAFNDPPYANFKDPVWVKVVQLDEASRRQQIGEGHFPNLEAVPTHAITLTIPALLSAARYWPLFRRGAKLRRYNAHYRDQLKPVAPPASYARLPMRVCIWIVNRLLCHFRICED